MLPAFLADAAAGALPHVSFVDPRFLGELEGLSNDDHPHADIRNGQAFLNLTYTAVTTSPAWDRTVLVITYEEWGGFFDHVPPGYAPDRVRAHAFRGFARLSWWCPPGRAPWLRLPDHVRPHCTRVPGSAGPFGTACLASAGAAAIASGQPQDWAPLRDMAERAGIQIG